ncbi:cupin domain-containing protein [Geodermatophilus nigrescens]
MTTAPDTTATARLLAADVSTGSLTPLPLPPATVRAGDPAAAQRTLVRLGDTEVGVWELSEGTVTDVEDDEVFLVIAGAGSVTFSDGSAITLRPGTAVRLVAGDRTVWTVQQRLRKLYLA